jgi:hypothetical protein
VKIRNANEYSGGYYECTVGTYFMDNGIKTTFETETITQFTQYKGEKNNNIISNSSNILPVICLKYILILIFFINLYQLTK